MCQRPAIKSEASRCLCPFVGGPAIKGDAGFYGVCKRFKTPFKPPPREPPLTYRPGLMLCFCFFRWRVYAVCLAFTGGAFVAVLVESGTGRARCGFKYQPCKTCHKQRPYTRRRTYNKLFHWYPKNRIFMEHAHTTHFCVCSEDPSCHFGGNLYSHLREPLQPRCL